MSGAGLDRAGHELVPVATPARRRPGVSLKWRIAALTAALLVVFAALLGGAVLTALNASLIQSQRDVLVEDAQRLESLYRKAEETGQVDPQSLGRLKVGLYRRSDGSWLQGPRLAIPTAVIIAAGQGTLSTESFRIGEEPALAVLVPTEVAIGDRQKPIRVRAVLAVATTTTYINDAIRNVSLTVAAVTLLLVALALAGGYWAASFGLRPLVEVARQATRLNETNLHPLAYAGPRDELGLLTTTLNRLVERLRRAFDAQKVFLAETSHELRTPLTALEGYIHRALREAGPGQRPVLEDALRVSRSMTRLVSDLLQLSRGDVVKEWVPHLVDLGQVASSVTREFPGVTCDCPLERAEMIGDPDRLTQLTRNLIANAVRAVGRPEGVAVSVQATLERVELHVRDSGPGIPPEILPNIFAKFYRGPQGGSGLGLAIVSQIVRVHGGEVHVESQPGQGAHFWATFPAYQEDE